MAGDGGNGGERSSEQSAGLQSDLVARMKGHATACASAAIMGILFMVIQNEVAWMENTTAGVSSRFCADARDYTCDPRDAAAMFPIRNSKLLLDVLRGVGVSATTLVALLYLYRYYQARLQYMQVKNQLPFAATLLSTPRLRWRFALEACVLAIHVFPGIDEVFTDSPALYLACSQLMFLRWFFLIRVVVAQSSMNGSNGRFISALTHVQFSSSFIMKTVLKDRPVVVVGVTLGVLLFSAAYAVRMIESLMCSFDRSLGCMPISFEDSAWLMIVTMLTIGFGDITAKTSAGRFVVISCGIAGTISIAATVALLAESLQLSRSEAKVVTFLRKHDYRRRVTNAAALCIQTVYRLHKLRRGGFLHDAEDVMRRALAKEINVSNGKRGILSGPAPGKNSPAASHALASHPTPSTASSSSRGFWLCCRRSGSGDSSTVVPVSTPTPGGGGGNLELPVLRDKHGGGHGLDSVQAEGSASNPLALAMSPFSGGRKEESTRESDAPSAHLTHSAASGGHKHTRGCGCGYPAWLCCGSRRTLCCARVPGSGSNVPASGLVGGGVAQQPIPVVLTTQTKADIVVYEHRLFQSVESFRAIKRFVLSHDPSDPTDRQLTILETLEVNVDEIRSNVETLSEFLLSAGAAIATATARTVGTEGSLSGAGAIASSDGGGVSSQASLMSALPPAAQEQLTRIAAERSGKLAANASRSALLAASSRQLSVGGTPSSLPRELSSGQPAHAPAGSGSSVVVHQIDNHTGGMGGTGMTAELKRAGGLLREALLESSRSNKEGGWPHAAATSYQTPFTPPHHGIPHSSSPFGPEGSGDLVGAVERLAADLSTTLKALHALHTSFTDYRQVTDVKIAALEHAVARSQLPPQPMSQSRRLKQSPPAYGIRDALRSRSPQAPLSPPISEELSLDPELSQRAQVVHPSDALPNGDNGGSIPAVAGVATITAGSSTASTSSAFGGGGGGARVGANISPPLVVTNSSHPTLPTSTVVPLPRIPVVARRAESRVEANGTGTGSTTGAPSTGVSDMFEHLVQ